MHVLARLTVVALVGLVVRAAWGRYAQGPHRSVPGAPVVHPPLPPGAAEGPADAEAPPADDYRRMQA